MRDARANERTPALSGPNRFANPRQSAVRKANPPRPRTRPPEPAPARRCGATEPPDPGAAVTERRGIASTKSMSGQSALIGSAPPRRANWFVCSTRSFGRRQRYGSRLHRTALVKDLINGIADVQHEGAGVACGTEMRTFGMHSECSPAASVSTLTHPRRTARVTRSGRSIQ